MGTERQSPCRSRSTNRPHGGRTLPFFVSQETFRTVIWLRLILCGCWHLSLSKFFPSIAIADRSYLSGNLARENVVVSMTKLATHGLTIFPVSCLKSVSQRDTAVSSQKRPKSVLDTDDPYHVACLIIAEEKARFRTGRSITVQSVKLIILVEEKFQQYNDGFYNCSDIYRPTNFTLNISTQVLFVYYYFDSVIILN